VTPRQPYYCRKKETPSSGAWSSRVASTYSSKPGGRGVGGWGAAQPGSATLKDGSTATIPELYLERDIFVIMREFSARVKLGVSFSTDRWREKGLTWRSLEQATQRSTQIMRPVLHLPVRT
jgi:hypothetical protein